ncbi:MAG: cell division protein FtsQ/DivIB [Planctomycetota bacterium]
MAKKKRKKRKSRRISFKLGTSEGKKKPKTSAGPSLMSLLKVSAVAIICAAVAVGFVLLDKYVKKSAPLSERAAGLELVDVPAWVNELLEERMYEAAVASGDDIEPDEGTARLVQENIERLVGWVEEVRVQAVHDRLLIEARWRKPVALVESGRDKFYVDGELVVLDFVPISNLPIVRIKGLSVPSEIPPPGQVWHGEDLAAGVTILAKLGQMDETVTPDKPLLYEIDSIDVSNLNGRRKSRDPHILLYTKDDTEIIWGAQFGTWQRYLEAPDEEKLAKLYSYYKEFGTLLGGAKYINLRDPQQTIPRPTDKY